MGVSAAQLGAVHSCVCLRLRTGHSKRGSAAGDSWDQYARQWRVSMVHFPWHCGDGTPCSYCGVPAAHVLFQEDPLPLADQRVFAGSASGALDHQCISCIIKIAGRFFRPAILLLIDKIKQLLHGVSNGHGAGLLHSGDLAVSPRNTDGGDPMGGSAQHIKFCVTHHDRMLL